MRNRGTTIHRLLPALGLLPALAFGAYLYLRDAQAATPAPTPAHAAVASRATTRATPPATATLVATRTVSSGPIATPTWTPTPAPTATPIPTWVEVARWRDSQIIYTEPFTVQGPWRIRWRLAAPTELFQLMIEEGLITPILLTGAAGATEGVFEETRGGTFSLMLHNTIPYEVIVEEFRAPP